MVVVHDSSCCGKMSLPKIKFIKLLFPADVSPTKENALNKGIQVYRYERSQQLP